jgi:hypothetical protein
MSVSGTTLTAGIVRMVSAAGPESRPVMLDLSLSGHDPGCVKTHTEKRCGKYNSLTGRRITPAQYDLTLTGRNCFKMFYAREASRSFHTAWTLTGHRIILTVQGSPAALDSPHRRTGRVFLKRFLALIEASRAQPRRGAPLP